MVHKYAVKYLTMRRKFRISTKCFQFVHVVMDLIKRIENLLHTPKFLTHGTFFVKKKKPNGLLTIHCDP